MPFQNSNDFLTGRAPAPTAAGLETVTVRGEVSLVIADLDANDVGAVVVLPAGHVPVLAFVDSEDLDTNGTPTIVAQLGICNAGQTDLSTTAADGGAVWVTGLTVAQAGGMVAAVGRPMSQVQPSAIDRLVGIKFSAAAATKQAGRIGVTLQYRAA
jgi:hypothetical protein